MSSAAPIDYTIYYREDLTEDADYLALPVWDLFVTAFNKSQRVRGVYDRIRATKKLWVIHDEYGLDPSDLPPETTFAPVATDESGFVTELLDALREQHGWQPDQHSICIDITGFMRPHLMYLMLALSKCGVRKLHAIYAEPIKYMSAENTPFSGGAISEVRPVQGFEGLPNANMSRDLLIVGMGYDDRMLAETCEDKDKAEKIQLFGWPSLRADMYQQSVLRSRKAADSLGDPNFDESHRAFAPANDPFATASILSELIHQRGSSKPITNLFLSPLGTKAQALGFAIYYIQECIGTSATMIFPFSRIYAPETSEGLAKAWCFTVEFDAP